MKRAKIPNGDIGDAKVEVILASLKTEKSSGEVVDKTKNTIIERLND